MFNWGSKYKFAKKKKEKKHCKTLLKWIFIYLEEFSFSEPEPEPEPCTSNLSETLKYIWIISY